MRRADADKADDGDGEYGAGKGHEHVGNAHEHAVQQAAGKARSRSDQDARDGHDAGDRKGNQQRGLSAVQDSGIQISPQLVGSE